jgi:hypothetical protein
MTSYRAVSPSLAQLAKTTAVALAAAAAILVAFVLPAEYGLDPIGTGRLLGLTDIASPRRVVAETAAPPGAPLAPVPHGPMADYPAEYKLDVFEITLQPYEYVEYKYQLEQGATMLYSWNASAPVIHDFHGERAGAASDAPAEESFDKSDRRQASGSFTAPFSGIHGWYWENPGADPIRVRLTSSGFYTSAVEIRSDRTRTPHPLKSLDALAPAPPGDISRTGSPTGDAR